MGNLESSICYLVGPIDFAADQGIGFREEIKQQLSDIGIVFLDPCHKMENLAKDVGEEQNTILKYKRENNFAALRTLMKKIIRADLRMIDYCDFTICYIDIDIHMCGSYHEMINSLSQKKPTLIIIKGGIERAPSWIFGLSKIEYMFNSIEELSSFLHSINSGETPLGQEWVLIRKQLKAYDKESNCRLLASRRGQ